MGATEAVERLIPDRGVDDDLLAQERRQVEALCQRAQQALNDLGLGVLVVRPSGHGTIMTFGSVINRQTQDNLTRRLEDVARAVERYHNSADA